MPYRNNPYNEIEVLMNFNYLYLFKLNEHKKIITLQNQTMKISYSKSKIKSIFMWEKS